MEERGSRKKGNVLVWLLVTVVVAVAAYGVWVSLQGRRSVVPPMREEAVEAPATEALPTLTTSDTVTDIEADLNAIDTTSEDALFSDIDRDLQSL